MAHKIKLKQSSTTTAVPTAGQLEVGELAYNSTDNKLWIKDAAAAVNELVFFPEPIDLTGAVTGSMLWRDTGPEWNASASVLINGNGTTLEIQNDRGTTSQRFRNLSDVNSYMDFLWNNTGASYFEIVPYLANVKQSADIITYAAGVWDIPAATTYGGNHAIVPTGGTAGQVLVKDSITDYDSSWGDGAFPEPLDLTGAANNDMLYRVAGTWEDTAGLLTWDASTLSVLPAAAGGLTITAGTGVASLIVEGDTNGQIPFMQIGNSAVLGGGTPAELHFYAEDTSSDKGHLQHRWQQGLYSVSIQDLFTSAFTTNRWSGFTTYEWWDGAIMKQYASGNSISMQTTHDGTDFETSFLQGTTVDWDVEALTGNFWLRDGAGLKISDASDTDTVVFSCDGTDFNTVITSIQDWNVSGATAAYSWATSAGGILRFTGTSLTVDRNANGVTALNVGETTTLRGNAQESYIRLYAEDTSVISYGMAEYDGINMQLTVTGSGDIRTPDNFKLITGASLILQDSTNADTATFSHDGTDFNTAFVTTVDWNITGLTGAINVPTFANFPNGTGGGIKIENTAGTPQLVLYTAVTSDRVILRNMVNSADIRIQASDSSSNVQNGYIFNADAASSLYHGATNEVALATVDRSATDEVSSLTMLSAGGATVNVGEATERFFTKNESFTMGQVDHGRIFYKGNGTGYTWTTPASTNTEIPNGWWAKGVVQGATAVTIAVGSGVNLRFLDGSAGAPPTGTRTVAQAGEFTIHKRTDTEYYIKGTGIT